MKQKGPLLTQFFGLGKIPGKQKQSKVYSITWAKVGQKVGKIWANKKLYLKIEIREKKIHINRGLCMILI